jgi:hypothetical protein
VKIRNVHERRMLGATTGAGELFDSLGGPGDRLWPSDRWPPMKLDDGLNRGSSGGHGPVRYCVTAYDPGRRVVFSFLDSGLAKGMRGGHGFEVVATDEGVMIRHELEATCGVMTWLLWGLVIRPLHDALLEDALDRAERAMNPESTASSTWSPWVRLLRSILARQQRATTR